jgi:hypothetical protein
VGEGESRSHTGGEAWEGSCVRRKRREEDEREAETRWDGASSLDPLALLLRSIRSRLGVAGVLRLRGLSGGSAGPPSSVCACPLMPTPPT